MSEMFFRLKKGATLAQIKLYVKGTAMTQEEALTVFHAMLIYVLDQIKKELKAWILKFVPKRTGQLQDNMLRQLESSSVKKGLMRLVLGTNIDYAPKVAEMSTSQVAHDQEVGYAYYWGASGRLILDDPDAIGDFWEELKKYTIESLQSILARAIGEFFKGTGKVLTNVRGNL